MSRQVTLLDIARLAGVSPSTVSNLLNGRDDRMRPSTKERIQQTIDRIGYTPSKLGRQLKTGRAAVIGLIVPSVANPFWGAMAQAVEEMARSRGYHVLLGNSGRMRDIELAYAEEMWSQGIRGIIFGSSPPSFAYLQNLIKRGLHIVAFDRPAQRDDRLDIDSVAIDNVVGARLAMEHLLVQGHRRIGFLSGPIRTVSRLNRLEGYRSALVAAGIATDRQLIWEGSENSMLGDIEGTALGRVGARELLGLPDRPTALLAINDMYALGAYAGARDLGLHVPASVSIVGFDDIVLAEVVDPPLTTVRQPLRDMTRVAVEQLIGYAEQAAGNTTIHLTLTPELIMRGSTASPTPRHGDARLVSTAGQEGRIV